VLRGKVRAVLIVLVLPLAWPAASPAQNETGVTSAPPATAPAAPAAPAKAPRPRRSAPRVSAALAELVDWVKGRGGLASVRISDSDTGAIWAEANPALPLNPASNMKVLTAAAALSRLGAEYRFSTGLYGEVVGGRVDPLVLRGHGDPSLGVRDLWELARALGHLGVKEVGSILVDQSRFDEQFVPPGFEQQPKEWAGFRAPVSAVALERNAVTLHVLAAGVGQPAQAWFEPPGVVTIDGVIETRRPGSGEAIQLSMEARPDALVAHIGGHVAEGLPRLRFSRRLDDPRRAPGLALSALLAEREIRVTGSVALGGAAVKPRLVFHESEPLEDLLQELGKNSDNFYAETFFKVLGAETAALPARSADGARAVLGWLSEHDLVSPGTRIENGSGLFDTNRVSAETLVGTLAAVYRSPAIYPEFLAQLSIGGVDGTLRSRFRALTPKRSVRAKTGTLSAAIGLSGYLLSNRGLAPVAFSFLINDIEGYTGEARQRIDRVVEAIAKTLAQREP
jgi:serine-type D-Ala-D-Ala carboxypeptidase/endopeptidase (penicillin-binding protein 4)